MYCPQCDHFIDVSDLEYSYSDDDYNYSFDEEEMSWDDWDYNAEQMEAEDFVSPLKRKRSESRVPDERPLKRVCGISDISRADAPTFLGTGDSMQID